MCEVIGYRQFYSLAQLKERRCDDECVFEATQRAAGGSVALVLVPSVARPTRSAAPITTMAVATPPG